MNETKTYDKVDYARVSQLTTKFGISKNAVHDLIARGELKAVRIGRMVLITTESVEEFESRLLSAGSI